MLALALALALLPAASFAAGDVAVNAATFPDARFREYVSSNFDTNGDGKLSAAEIAAVRTVNVYYGSCKDLTGIGYFTAMTDLNSTINMLGSLDVSRNTALKELVCQYDGLTELDVSRNTALTVLDCCYNRITDLDLSRNTALKSLACGDNPLTSLDLSNCAALEDLNLWSTTLKELDVSRNVALKRLICFGSGLTALDVSRNTALKSLECSFNQLTSLDLSKNTALTRLYCSQNNIAELDVSGVPALRSVVLSGKRETGDGCVLYSFEDGSAELEVDETVHIITEARKPGAVSEMTAAAGSDGILLSWSAAENASTYLIQRREKGEEWGSWSTIKTNVSGTSYLDAAVTPKALYQYRVRGRAGAVNGPFKTGGSVRAAAAAKPGAIASVTATASAGKITVAWKVSAGAATYTIQRQTYGETAWKTVRSGVSGLSYADTGVTGGTKYRYRVRGVNAAGSGAFKVSSYVAAAAAKPGAIASVTATASAGKVTVSWKASANAVTYLLQRQVYGESAWTTVKSGHKALTYTDTAVAAGTRYRYRVRGVNDAGAGAFKVSSYARTPAASKPGAISSVTVTPGAGKVTVKWAASSGANTYQVQRQAYGETAWVSVAPSASALTCADAKAVKGTKYRYRVRGRNDAGYGAFKVSGYVTAK